MTVIFTIARQNGSGGREIARILSERLGIRSYDKELITETAKAAGITEDEVYAREERQKRGGFYYYGLPDDNPMHRYQFDAIRALADRGESCVFVGRCSDSVLDGREGLVKVFISASMEKCIERSAQRNGISEKEACARVSEKNRERAHYYQRYTGLFWGNAANYDLCIDTSRISLEQAVDLIVEYARMRGLVD